MYAYERICDVVLELTRRELHVDEDKHDARSVEAGCFFLHAKTTMRDKRDDIMTSMIVIDTSDNVRILHTWHYMVDIMRPVLATWAS